MNLFDLDEQSEETSNLEKTDDLSGIISCGCVHFHFDPISNVGREM
jgi:hypothetical protein